MAYWLLKTEPSVYSFDDLTRDGKTCWDGITNPAALKFLRSAAVGDLALVYHTGDERCAVGVAKVVSSAYPDPSGTGDRPNVIDLQAGAKLHRPVELAAMKADPAFADSPLLRQGRLSFVPITTAQWQRIEALARSAR